MPILQVKDLSYSVSGRVLLDNIQFTLEDQDFVAILGPNGAGKTTFLNLIMGLLTPTSGSVTLFGDIAQKTRHRVGYLTQFHTVDLSYPITAKEVVLMSRLRKGRMFGYTQQDHQDALSLLDEMAIGPCADRLLGVLSGGELQRVFLARMLMNDPDLLILDEPTTGVDIHAEQGFFDILKKLNQTTAILMVTHDLSAIYKHVKKIACLNKRLITHDSKELTHADLEKTYCCEIDLIAHGVPHRVLEAHDDDPG